MRQWIGMAGALLLAACSGGSEGGGGNEAADAKAGGGGGSDGVTMQPGEWEMTTTITKMDMAGMPAGVNPPMPAPQVARTCLTQEEVAQQNGALVAAGGNEGCTSENSSMSGGRIQATIQCNRPEGRTQMTMSGRYSATTIEVEQQVQTNAGGRDVQMESRIAGRRVGDCAPGAQ